MPCHVCAFQSAPTMRSKLELVYCVKQSKNESKKEGWKEEEPVECAALCRHNAEEEGVDCMLQQREVTEPPTQII